MNEQNHTSPFTTAKASAEHEFEALKDGLKKLVHRFDATPDGYIGKAARYIKTNPLAAVGIAFGLGYVAVRLLRRK